MVSVKVAIKVITEQIGAQRCGRDMLTTHNFILFKQESFQEAKVNVKSTILTIICLSVWYG